MQFKPEESGPEGNLHVAFTISHIARHPGTRRASGGVCDGDTDSMGHERHSSGQCGGCASVPCVVIAHSVVSVFTYARHGIIIINPGQHTHL